MFTVKVYNVMIGSLSGTTEEVFAAKEVIRKWNQENSKQSGKLFFPIEWNTNTNDLNEVDVVIGIVRNWIKDPGFIEDCLNAGKKVILFFNAFQDPKNTIQSEQDEVESLKGRIKDCCHSVEYRGVVELKQLVANTLKDIS